MNYQAIIDIETSSLDSRTGAILELGLLIIDENYKVIKEFMTRVKPFDGAVIEEQALKINGLSAKDWENAPTEGEMLSMVNNILNEYGAPVLVFFNSNFDSSFILSACFRNKIRLVYSGYTLDVRGLGWYLRGSYKWSLKTMASEYGIENNAAHSSLGDCHTTLKLLEAIETGKKLAEVK